MKTIFPLGAQHAVPGSLHHVEVNVSDVRKSKEFWGWLLRSQGYAPDQEWEQGFSLRQGNSYLVFVQVDERHQEAGFHRGRAGLNHVAFHADSREQVDLLTQELDRRGIPVLYRDRHPHAGGPDHYAVFFEDPDRIKVEWVAPNRA